MLRLRFGGTRPSSVRWGPSLSLGADHALRFSRCSPCRWPRQRPDREDGALRSVHRQLGTDIVTHEQNGVEHRGNGEICFGWVLEGRAIQDVWMYRGVRSGVRVIQCCLLPATGTAPRCGSTIPALMPGTSCGPIRPIKSTRNRLDGHVAKTSSRKGNCRPARSCAGALPKSPPIPSAGSESIQWMTAFPGGFRSRCLRVAPAQRGRCQSGENGHRGRPTSYFSGRPSR